MDRVFRSREKTGVQTIKKWKGSRPEGRVVGGIPSRSILSRAARSKEKGIKMPVRLGRNRSGGRMRLSS